MHQEQRRYIFLKQFNFIFSLDKPKNKKIKNISTRGPSQSLPPRSVGPLRLFKNIFIGGDKIYELVYY